MALLTSMPVRALLTLTLGSGVLARPASAQVADSSLEYGVKAAYLLNFTRYVEWPPRVLPSSSDPLILCVYGENPFGDQLERTVRGRTSQGHPIEVRQTDGIDETTGCHAVFLSAEEWRRRPGALRKLGKRGILTIGEGAAFAEAGGVISLVIDNEAVRFVVNRTAGRKAGLRLSSRLLAIADKVYGEPTEDGR